jgi:plasmid stabilization system protein ParE
MKYRVVVQPRAAADIENAYLWIRERAPSSADRWFHGIYEVIEKLQTLPAWCPLAPENDYFEEEIREIFYGKRIGRYRILFAITGDTVHILHVRHGRRLRLGERPQEGED